MRIAIDIDGTICHLKEKEQKYDDVIPLKGAVEKITSLKNSGHYIILLTARHMKTCNGNIGLVIARQGKTLLSWLERYKIPYDEIWFGKPHADIYIDDNGFRLISWDMISDNGNNLPRSSENKNCLNKI
jgi:capsule biosynthesis phosphatase